SWPSSAVSLKITSFSTLAEWGAHTSCTNNNTYAFYMDLESSPTLTTQRGASLTSSPSYGNFFCGGNPYPCQLSSVPITVSRGESYKWKVTACNGAGSCRDSDTLHFTVADASGWWQAVGGGDIYGMDVRSVILN
ncbi:MAG: hypothetical protein Q7S14_01935, partial [bacterium]|nr:hypothetical protein [bacterium]